MVHPSVTGQWNDFHPGIDQSRILAYRLKKQKNTICARIRYQYDRIKAKGEHSKFANRRRYFKKIARAEALPQIKGQGSRRKWPGYFPELPSYLIPEGLEDWIDERKV